MLLTFSKGRGCNEPARISSHCFDEFDRVLLWQCEHIHCRVHCCQSNKAGRSTIARAMISVGQVIINGFGNTDDSEIVPLLLSRLLQDMGCIRRVIATEIEHIVNLLVLKERKNMLWI